MVDCPYSHIDQSLSPDFNRTAESLTPSGTCDQSCVTYGQCYKDSTYFSDSDITQLSECMAEIFSDYNVTGSFIWTVHNQMDEDRWSFVGSYAKGWMDAFYALNDKQ